MNQKIIPLTPIEHTPNIIELSRKKGRVTVDEVRSSDYFHDWTDEQITELLKVVDTFCEIAYNIWTREEEKRQSISTTIPLIPLQKKAA